MRKLLTLYTKNAHFSFKNEIYIQIEDVTRSSPLGPMVANIFMAELENTLVPKLEIFHVECRSDDFGAFAVAIKIIILL